jgi:hypothetical protein
MSATKKTLARTLAETQAAPAGRTFRPIRGSTSRERRRINADALPLDRWRERSPRVGSIGACAVVAHANTPGFRRAPE